MSESIHSQTPLSLAALERFCHVVGQSLRSGQSFVESLRSYCRTDDWDGQSVIDAVVAGESAASALKMSGAFPELLIGMVEVGEASGRLDQTLLRLADYYRELIRSRRVFQQGIFWPVLQWIAAAIVLSLLFFALDYLQRRVTVLVAPDLFGFGLQPLQNMAIVIGVACVFLSVLGLFSWWWSRGRMPSQLFKLLARLPWVGTTLKRIATSRFAWTLGAAIDAGTDAVTAARLAVRGSSNATYQRIEEQLVQALENGDSFEDALARTRKFPPELIQAVAVGESTGQVTECVQRLAVDYDERNAVALRQFGQVSGMVVSLSVVLLLGFTVVSMYSQYLGMVSGALRANSRTLEEIRGDMLAGAVHSEGLRNFASGDQNAPTIGSNEQGSNQSDSTSSDAVSKNEADNQLLQTRDRMVEDFIENNADFKKIETIYGTLSRFNELTPNDFLDAIVDGPSASNPQTRSEAWESRNESETP